MTDVTNRRGFSPARPPSGVITVKRICLTVSARKQVCRLARLASFASVACLLAIGCAEPVTDSLADAGSAGSGTTPPTPTVIEDAPAEPETTPDSEPVVTEETTKPKTYNTLTEFEQYVLLNKGTERAFVGEYTDTKDPGTYICRQCNARLYKSDHKFHSNCGWPAFDDEIEGAVTHRPETDGTGRTEIICTNCKGHLGHVFLNEGFTAKQTRHCVNSVSMTFVPEGEDLPEVIVLDK